MEDKIYTIEVKEETPVEEDNSYCSFILLSDHMLTFEEIKSGFSYDEVMSKIVGCIDENSSSFGKSITDTEAKYFYQVAPGDLITISISVKEE